MERRELEAAIGEGLSIAQLAARFGCSKANVRHWLAKCGLKTQHRSKRESSPEVIAARAAGLTKVVRECAHHGVTTFVADGKGVFRCKLCRARAVVGRRRRVKETLVREAGGRCEICGYDRYIGALAFHHVDPSTKVMGIANGGRALAIDTLRAEAQKCVLLCHTCHAELEGGVVSLPVK